MLRTLLGWIKYLPRFEGLKNIFAVVMKEKWKEIDMETHFKDAFRAFSKDKEGLDDCSFVFSQIHIFIFKGCIPAEELKFVMNNLPGHVSQILSDSGKKF